MAPVPAASPGYAGAYRPSSWRGVDGYFRLAQQVTGQWWLIDPAGRPFFAKAVHGVRAEPVGSDGLPALADPAARLRAWGCNAVGVGGDGSGRDDGLAYLAAVDFFAEAAPIVAPGIRLPDIFDSQWPQRAVARAAAVCAPAAATTALIGWVTDASLHWGSPAPHRPGLLQVCLSLEPGYAAYHAAWEFVLALHAGSLEALARSWAVPLANKEGVREMTRRERGIATRGYLRDEARWLREFARRYFVDTAEAIRRADPNHLVCGCRFNEPVGATLLSAATYPSVDLPLTHWLELPAAANAMGPVLASEVTWASESFWGVGAGAAAKRPARITSVERMIRRARTALKRLARHPAVVGYAWRQWHDEPGEQPPFGRGLVHVQGTEAREHTELLTEFNLRADSVRRSAAKHLSP